jgi:hypothetical protein
MSFYWDEFTARKAKKQVVFDNISKDHISYMSTHLSPRGFAGEYNESEQIILFVSFKLGV